MHIRVLVIAALMGPLAALACGASAPAPVSAWLARLRSEDPAQRAGAAYGLSVPADCPPGELASLIGALKDKDVFVRQYAAAALGEIPPATEETIPALIGALADTEDKVREQAAIALWKIGEPALAPLVEKLAQMPAQGFVKTNGELMAIAASLSSHGSAIVDPLLTAVRAHTPLPQETGPVIDQVGKKEPFDGFLAMASFLLRRVELSAVPALVAMLGDERLSTFSGGTLHGIAPAAELVRQLEGSNPAVAQYARQALAGCGGTTAGLVASILEGLKSEEEPVRRAAIAALQSVADLDDSSHVQDTKEMEATAEPLAKALLDENAEVRAAAAACLRGISETRKLPRPPVALLMDALRGTDTSLRVEVATILGQLRCREALPPLITCARDPECPPEALMALATIGRDDPAAIEAILDAVRLAAKKEGWCDETGLAILEQLGGAARPVLKILIDTLHRVTAADQNEWELAKVIARIDADGVAALAALLNEAAASTGSKTAACAGLALVARSNASAKVALTGLLVQSDKELRFTAARALLEAGEVEVGRAVLEEMMRDEETMITQDRVRLFTCLNPDLVADLLPKAWPDLQQDLISALEVTGVMSKKLGEVLVTLFEKGIGHWDTELLKRLDRARVVSAASKFLLEENDALREEAAELINEIEEPSQIGPLARKVMNDKMVATTFAELTTGFSDIFPGRDEGKDALAVAAAGPPGKLPNFPWPPPPYSAMGTFGRLATAASPAVKGDFPAELLGDAHATLGSVHDRLKAALRECNLNFQSSLFAAPGGFAMFTRMERVDANGAPLNDEDRWNLGKVPPRSLMDYMSRLFVAKPGFFRVIVFVVTDQLNFKPDDQATLPKMDEGYHNLPTEMENVPFQGLYCHALIYSIERKAGGAPPEVIPPANAMDASIHLTKAGIISALGGKK